MNNLDDRIRQILKKENTHNHLDGTIESANLIEDMHRDTIHSLKNELDISFEAAKFMYIERVTRIEKEEKIKGYISTIKGLVVGGILVAIILWANYRPYY